MSTPPPVDLQSQFPDLQKARACANQDNHAMASDLFSDVLNALTAQHPQDDPAVCYIYIDYANSLVRNCTQFFTSEYLNIANHAGASHGRRSIEDDLEIAWNVLEIAKVVLQKDRLASMKIRYLLGEILLLNNNFNDAVCEYTESMALSDKHGTKYCECLLKIASCHEFMKDYGEANVSLRKIVQVYEAAKSEIGEERVKGLVVDIQERIEFNETKYKPE